MYFLDETGFKRGMAQSYGRATKGERFYIPEPKSKAPNQTLIMAMGLHRTIAPFLFNSAMNSGIFIKWLTEELIPSLKKGDAIVMDNLTAHRTVEVQKVILDAGMIPVYLPPYCPDMNPIEFLFSKLKRYVRSFYTENFDDLLKIIKKGLRFMKKRDFMGWFKHAGYCVTF